MREPADIRNSLKEVTAAVRQVPPVAFEDFFELLRQQQYPKLITATTEEQRRDLHHTVKAISQVEEMLKQLRDSKKKVIDI